MLRKISLALLLCVLLAALSGCASEELFFPTQAPPNMNQPTATPSPTPEAQGEFEGNPLDEENFNEDALEEPQDFASAEAYAFAGSTPLPLDPIDVPTPTPRPALTFNYQTYEATKLGLKFDGPANWDVDDSAEDTFTITEPVSQRNDNYSAFITIRKSQVTKQYNASDMENEVEDILDTIKSTNYTEFRPSYTAPRTLLDEDGVYADYQGTMVDGTRVRGRVHVTCIDKVLYTVHMSHPGGYNTDYLKNHGKLRDTITLTK